MKTILEKNYLNGSYLLYTSLKNGFAWYFSSYKAASKARKKLDELIKDKETSKDMSYREVTKYILNN
jgi:hypothetical protein